MSAPGTGAPDTPPTGSTAADLIAFWDWAQATGQVRHDTGRANKLACHRILSTRPQWQSLDARALDPEALIDAFMMANTDVLAIGTIDNYASTFRKALGLFRDYLADPDGWTPLRPRHRKRPRRPIHGAERTPGHLQILLAEGRTAELIYPADLTSADAAAAIHTLRKVLPTLPGINATGETS
ncbi:MAG: hypothetical protein HOW97_02945 [Catenulispora sp.]|nr:hypothetical protein [Catenulispora sp.]